MTRIRLFGIRVVLTAVLAFSVGAASSHASETGYGENAQVVGPGVTVQPDAAAAQTLLNATVSEDVVLSAEAGSEESRPDKAPEVTAPQKEDPTAQPDEVQSLKLRIIDLQNKGKLGFRKMVVCSSVEGYGMYSPAAGGEAAHNMVLYFEPLNVSTLVSGDRYVIDCTIDQFAYDAAGKLVGGKSGILKLYRVSRSPVLDLFFRVNIDFKKPPQGGLTLRTVLRDNIKNQSATAVHRINVVAGPKKPAGSI